MTDNNDNDESGLTAALYRSYRSRRHGVGQEGTSVQGSMDHPGSQAISESEALYARYQRSRGSSDDAVSVDALLDIVRNEYTAESQLQHDQSDVTGTTPIIDSISVAQGRIGVEDEAGNAAGRHSPQWWKGSAVGIAAAVVLAIILIPQLLQQSPPSDSSRQTVPLALSNDAARAVAFVDLNGADSFAFSDAEFNSASAFSAGVLNVNLRVSADASNQRLLKTLLGALSQITAEVAAINSETDFQQRIQTAYSAIDTGATTDDVSVQVQALLDTLESAMRTENQFNAYLAGSSVESIRIASDIALEHGDFLSLEQALAQGKTVTLPVFASSVDELLSDLVNYPLVAKERFIQVDEIKKMAEGIKLVMQ